MKAPQHQWFTCTPFRFKGDHTFFARDSGLLCKGFQEIGIPCKAIMPGPPMDDDQTDDLIRTDYQNLEDPEWWRSLNGEGIVLYAWGAAKYRRIAKAIKQAGMILVTHIDAGGILGIFNGSHDFIGFLWRVSQGERSNRLLSLSSFAIRLAYAYSLGIFRNDLGRSKHLKQADIIGAITPIAMERIRKVCRFYGGEALAQKVRLIPHPNASYMRYDESVPKENLVVAVGRWDDALVKGTNLLAETIRLAARDNSTLQFEIYGNPGDILKSWHDSLPSDIAVRIKLLGIVRNEQIRMALQHARVSLCTSLRESYHIPSAEALCCGCSVVGPNTPEIPSMKWFATEPHGQMAERNPLALATALKQEIQAWEAGRREPSSISRHWTQMLHAPRIARQILQLVDVDR